MAFHGHPDGRAVQAPGLMRHGPFPPVGLPGREPLDPSRVLDIMENKVAVQAAEMEELIRENQRLATSHVTLRQDIVNTEKELQMIRGHLSEVQLESDMQMRDLMERINMMEADIHAGAAIKQELHHRHMEAKGLIAVRQELTNELQHVTSELQKVAGNNKNIAELHAELDELRKEHQCLRSAFEHEKNTNIKQVEQMQTMEMNLITMANEADKLRADVANAEKRAQGYPFCLRFLCASFVIEGIVLILQVHLIFQQAAAQAAAAQAAATQPGTTQVSAVTNPYGSAYPNPPVPYQQATQAGPYAYAPAYQYPPQASGYAGYAGYPVAGYPQSTHPNYHGSYAAPQHPISSGVATDVANMYGAVGSGGYPVGPVQTSGGYPVGPVQTSGGYPVGAVQTSGGAAPGGQAVDPYGRPYDPSRGVHR